MYMEYYVGQFIEGLRELLTQIRNELGMNSTTCSLILAVGLQNPAITFVSMYGCRTSKNGEDILHRMWIVATTKWAINGEETFTGSPGFSFLFLDLTAMVAVGDGTRNNKFGQRSSTPGFRS